jgi:hypothetical protein
VDSGSRKGLKGWSKVAAAVARLRSVLNAWDAGVAAVLGTNLQNKAIPKDVRFWYSHVRAKLAKIATTQGIEVAVVLLKEFAADCRRAWITNTAVTHFLWKAAPKRLTRSASAHGQLSFLGRALPEGSARQIQKALSNHFRDLTSTFRTLPTHLDSVQEWVRNWAIRHLPPDPKPSTTIGVNLSISSTLSKTRRKGGMTADLRELLEKSPVTDAPPPDNCPHSVWSAVMTEVRLVAGALQELPDRNPRGKVAVIAERGNKARVVTVMERDALVLGHLARKRLMIGLRKWNLVSTALKGNTRGVVKELEGSTGDVISSDLRAASDLIPLDISDAMVRGLRLSGRLTDVELRGLERCVGPQDLEWKDLHGEGSGVTTATTSRGLLMGLPTTWSLLNLYHGWCWEAALATDPLPPFPKAPKPIRSKSRIFGDDLIGVTTPSGKHAYERRLIESGAELSAGKHFSSPNRGVFLECLWEFRGDSRRISDGIPIYRQLSQKDRKHKRVRVNVNEITLRHWKHIFSLPFIPLKGLVTGEPSMVANRETLSSAPDWWTAGVVETSYVRAGHDPKTVSAVARTLRPRLPNELARLGIPPFLPRELGGAGLVTTSNKLSAPSKHRKALASFLYGVGAHVGPSTYERVWSDSVPSPYRKMAAEDFDKSLRVQKNVKILGPDDEIEDGWTFIGDPEEVRESVILRNGKLLQLSEPSEGVTVQYPPMHVLASRLSKVTEGLLSRWKSAEPLSKPLSEVTLRWRTLREPLRLVARREIPDVDTPVPIYKDWFMFESIVAMTHFRINPLLVERSDLPYLSTWKRLATASVQSVSEN